MPRLGRSQSVDQGLGLPRRLQKFRTVADELRVAGSIAGIRLRDAFLPDKGVVPFEALSRTGQLSSDLLPCDVETISVDDDHLNA